MDYRRLLKRISQKLGIDFDYLIKNGLWVVFRDLITIVTGIGLSVAFARLASKEVFGHYQYFISILGIISIISIPGLNTSIIQSTARGFEGSYKKAVKTSFLWSLIGVPVLLILGGYYYAYQDQALGLVFMLASVFFPFLYAPNTWDAFFQGKERFDLSAKYISIQSIINTVALISVIFFFQNNLLLIILVYLASLVVFNVLWYLKSLKYIKKDDEEKDTIKYGWFLTKIRLPSLIAAHIDKIIIGIFLGPVELAVYSIGINFSKKFISFVKSFLSIASPKISQTNTVSLKKYSVAFLATAVGTVGLYLAFPYLISLLYTDKYLESIFLARLVIIFLPFYVINALYKSHFLFYVRNRSILLAESLIFPISKILLMIPLIIYFSTKGLAFLTGFQFLLNTIIFYILAKLSSKKSASAS